MKTYFINLYKIIYNNKTHFNCFKNSKSNEKNIFELQSSYFFLHHYKLKLPTLSLCFKIKFIYIKFEVIGNEIWDLNKEIQRYKGSNVKKKFKNNETKVYIYKPHEQHTWGKDIIFSSISI
jgi:hypothetical protein